MGQAGYGYVSFERSCDQNYGECWQLYYSPLEKVETLEPRHRLSISQNPEKYLFRNLKKI